MAGWSQLPPDILLLIAQRLNTRFGLLCLRSVCSSWHATVPSRLHPSCFLILPTNGTYGSLYLSRRAILCLRLPESHCQSTSCAWLIKVEEDVPGMAHLVNPLSTSQFKHLPPNFPTTVDFSRFRVSELGQEYVLQYANHHPSGEAHEWSLRKGKVTCSPATNGEDFAMLTIHESGKLAMFRPGDKRLTIIDDMPSRCDDLIYFNGEFYAVDNTGRTVVVSTGSPPVLSLIADSVSGGDKKSLVESNGELLLVDAYFFPGIRGLLKMAARFKVFKLDQTVRMWVEVESLGNQILFLGEKSTFSAAASEFCGCEGNCIYHTNTLFIRNGHRNDANTTIGIFNIENGNTGPLSSFPDYSKVIWPPPAWVYTDDIGGIRKVPVTGENRKGKELVGDIIQSHSDKPITILVWHSMKFLRGMNVVEVPTFLFIRDGELCGRYIGFEKYEFVAFAYIGSNLRMKFPLFFSDISTRNYNVKDDSTKASASV